MPVDILPFLGKNLFLVVVCAVSLALLVWPIVQGLATGAKNVSVPQTVQLINRRDAILLDVRDASEFAAGHLPNARNIPLAEIDKRIKELEKFKQRPLVVVCAGGNRAGRACALLKKNGFAEAFALKGGVPAWQQASMPIEK